MNNCILTAASEKYFISLQGLIASVRLNWSKTIPIIVYDLGLSKENIDLLATVGNLHVRAIPEFCPHWRKYYTWKLWAMSTVESDVCIWLDAGIFVLGSLDNVLDVTQRQGLFLIPNYQSLANEAPHAAVYSTGLTYAEITNRSSISANIIGFSRHNAYYEVIQKSFELGLHEPNLKGTHVRHRGDQALISCVLYSLYPQYIFFDGQIFAGWQSPTQVPGQKCWGQRRAILKSDVSNFWLQIGSCNSVIPRDPALHTPLYERTINWAKSQAARVLKRKGHNGIR